MLIGGKMLSKTKCLALQGLDGILVDVEVDILC